MNGEGIFGSEDTVGLNLLPFYQLSARCYYAQLELNSRVFSLWGSAYLTKSGLADFQRGKDLSSVSKSSAFLEFQLPS
jgi:hypothetical protein